VSSVCCLKFSIWYYYLCSLGFTLGPLPIGRFRALPAGRSNTYDAVVAVLVAALACRHSSLNSAVGRCGSPAHSLKVVLFHMKGMYHVWAGGGAFSSLLFINYVLPGGAVTISRDKKLQNLYFLTVSKILHLSTHHPHELLEVVLPRAAVRQRAGAVV